jgi:translation initiation factor IF-3
MINERLLRLDQVRLLGQSGEQLGVMSSRDALSAAQKAELDLVLVAPNADPPVCKIADYGKHKYDQAKAKKDHKRKTQEVKSVKLRPGTDTHDIGVLVKRATKFLGEGHKVRVTCVFRPRELAHPEVGREKLRKIAEALDTVGKLDREPMLAGREMVIVVSPVSGKKKDAKTENKEDGGQKVQGDRNGQDHAEEGL